MRNRKSRKWFDVDDGIYSDGGPEGRRVVGESAVVIVRFVEKKEWWGVKGESEDGGHEVASWSVSITN